MTSPSRTRSAFGGLLRQWRGLRGLSQLALAVRVETTTRHLSYLENGRSRPGRDFVLRLAEALDLPLRSRNELLAAAGLPVEFPATDIRSPALALYRGAMLRMIDAIYPFPAFVLDAMFNLEDANEVGRRLLPPRPEGERVNLVDVFLGPGPARDSIVNFAEVAWSWHARLLRATAAIATPEVEALCSRVEGYLQGVPRPPASAQGEPVICPTLRLGDTLVRTIGMAMRFGPSRDITLEEVSVDVLLPRDEASDRFFRALAAEPARSAGA